MKHIVLLVIVFVFFITSHSALATSAIPATPSASITVAPSEAQGTIEKINSILLDQATQKGLNASEASKLLNREVLQGYVGFIKSINSGNITIDTKESTIQITSDTNTAFVKSGSNIKISSIAIADKVIAIGTVLKEDIILGKRIVVIVDEPNPILSGTVIGKVSSLDLKKKIIGLTTNNTETLYGLTKKSTISLTDLEVGQTIFAITKKFDGKDLLSRAKVI